MRPQGDPLFPASGTRLFIIQLGSVLVEAPSQVIACVSTQRLIARTAERKSGHLEHDCC